MINEERIFIDSEVKLGATIAYKDKSEKRPLVLLIMGTGSLDRDGNGLGLKTNLYKDMSDMFVEMGCICIRYDKRGTHESSGKLKDCGVSDLVNDAASIINYAKKLDCVDSEKIVVCGHSEGAMIATLLTRNEDLQGIILLGGAGMGLKEAMLYQNYLVVDQANDMKGLLGWFLRKTIKKDTLEKQVLDIFEKAEHAKGEVFFYKGAFIPTKYMREHYQLTSLEYLKLLKEYKGKVLAITGKRDVQADCSVLDSIEADDIIISTPENVNHFLKEQEEGKDILNVKKIYKKSFKKEIAPSIKSTIKDWMNNI